MMSRLLALLLLPAVASAQDFELVSIDVPQTVVPGASGTFEYVLRNNGSVNLADARVVFRGSSSSAYDLQGTFVCEDAITGGLGANQQTTRTLICTWPASFPHTWVAARVIANPVETGTAALNNDAADGPLTVSGPSQPDLVPTSVALSATTLLPGDTVDVDVTVRNNGAGDAPGTSTTRVRYSSDAVLDGGDPTICSDPATPALPVGGQSVRSLSGCTLPLSAPAGGGWFFVEVDATGTLSESDESNNTATRQFTVAGSGSPEPDLVVDSLLLPPDAAQGTTVTATIAVRNDGEAEATSTVVRLRLSTDATYQASDTIFCETTTGVVGAGMGRALQASCTLSGAIPTGNGFVVARVDADGLLQESDEGNNDASTPFEVRQGSGPTGAPADLEVRIRMEDLTLDADTLFAIPWRVENDGDNASGPTTLEATWSDDNTPSADDTVLCDADLPAIPADERLEGRLVGCRVPANAAGPAWIFLRVDPDQLVSDADRSNNRDVQRVIVGSNDTAWTFDSAVPDTALPRDTALPGDTDDTPPQLQPGATFGGCGCATRGVPGPAALLLPVLLLARRRPHPRARRHDNTPSSPPEPAPPET